MLFVSCGSEDNGNGGDSGDPAEARGFADIVSEYLEYSGSKKNDPLDLGFSFSDTKDSQTLISEFGTDSDGLSDYVAVIKTTRIETFEADGITPRTLKDEYALRNAVTGSTIFNDSTSTYTYGSTPGKAFSFKTLANVIVEVGVTELVYVGDVYSHTAYTYKYFTLDGNNIATVDGTNNKVTVETSYPSGDKVVTVSGTAYVIRDDEIIYEFVAGTERDLPIVYASYGNLKYVIRNQYDNFFVQVLNKDYVCIFEYQLPNNLYTDMTAADYLVPKIIVLGNGNILVTGTYDAEEGSDDYDYAVYENKYCFYNALVDVKELEATELELEFRIDELYSANTEDNVCEIDKEYNAATIREFDKATNTEKFSYAILDNSLAIVETIPSEVYNQITGMEEIIFVDTDKFIFFTKVQYKIFTYLVDATTGERDLIATDASYMDGYFYTNDAIYDFDLNRLYKMDVDEYVYSAIGNSVIITNGTEYKIFTTGTDFKAQKVVDIANADNGTRVIGANGDYAIVEEIYDENKTRYIVCNSNGETLFVADYMPTFYAIADGVWCVVYNYNYTVTDTSGTNTIVHKKVVVLNCN